MSDARRTHNSIGLPGSPAERVYRSFEDWQDEQRADLRTPEQRGIRVGSPVMWRYRANRVIVTERAVVMAIDDQMLTLQVKDVQARTCNAHVNEIVGNPFGRQASAGNKWGSYIANQMETQDVNGNGYAREITPGAGAWR